MSDDLHPFLIQHVTMVDERPVAEILADADGESEGKETKVPVVKRPARNAPVKEQVKDLTPEQIEELHAEAIAFDLALFPKE